MASSSSLIRLVPAAALLAVVTLGACSSSKANAPTAPSTPTTANVAGTWINPATSYRWTLAQSGTTVTGTGSGVHPLGVPYGGTLTGSVAGDTFTFSEEQSWTLDSGLTQVEQVHSDQMRITRESMTGVVSFLPLFPPYRPSYGSVTMVRIAQVP